MITQPDRVEAALAAFARGEIIVVVDDDDRENEGDLILAAVHATPEKLAFILRHTSGIVCAPITAAIAARLQLPQMVEKNDDPHATAFTVSVDYRHGTTTGISADDRTATVRNLANSNSGAADFVKPGHIFPLVAREGGVLVRSGHTEAAVDLCRMAGLAPVGVICELMNEDGTVKRGAQVAAFAAGHGLQVVSVADIIAFRQRREKLVERVAEQEVATSAGPARMITYATQLDPWQHLAVVFGDLGDGLAVPVRIHREDVVRDVFAGKDPLAGTLPRLATRGVVIYLREGAVGVARSGARARDLIEAEGTDHHESAERRADEWREIGLGAQILRDLGVRSIRLLSTKPRRYVGLEGFGIAIEATEPL
ncbi:MAG: 3,4-dihydroxy-2-butanone-4-phosphate synthase [Bauldia sp.]|nr:3,4-dihydroxy-2-butanone-4-phosphate synthase [Bauldia sp.]